MELYDSIIKQTEALYGASSCKVYPYNPDRTWKDVGANQLIMLRDSAYELGGDSKPAVNYSCVSTADFIDKDEIVVYGRDLSEINGSVPFARIAIIKVKDLKGADEDDTEPVFRAIQDIDFVKYHVYPEGYMIRTSSENNREQVRISKDAIRAGISFERVGNTYIKKYKENPNIINVKLVFLTVDDADYEQMKDNAKKVNDITRTLSKILEGMSTDCNTCGLKSICDEVEGLKELHFGKNAKEFK